MSTPAPTTEAVRDALTSGPTCSLVETVTCQLDHPGCKSAGECQGHLRHVCTAPARWRFEERHSLQYGCDEHKVDLMHAHPVSVMTPYVGTLARSRS